MSQTSFNSKNIDIKFAGVSITLPRKYSYWIWISISSIFALALLGWLFPKILVDSKNRDAILGLFGNDFSLTRYSAYMTAIQSIATVFALVGVFIAAFAYKSQKDLQIKTMEAENRPNITPLQLSHGSESPNNNKFHFSHTEDGSMHTKKVFDIYPANSKKLYPLFQLVNDGKNYAQNLEVTLFGNSISSGNTINFEIGNTIVENFQPDIEKGKSVMIRKDDRYTGFNFENNFAIRLKYSSDILNSLYEDKYVVKVKTKPLIFFIKRCLFNSNLKRNTKRSTLLIYLDNGRRNTKYRKLRNEWESINQDHLIKPLKVGSLCIKYVEIPKEEVDDIFDEKYFKDRDYIFIKKYGSYINSFDKIT